MATLNILTLPNIFGAGAFDYISEQVNMLEIGGIVAKSMAPLPRACRWI